MIGGDTVRLTALVRGRVQGVGFRAYVRQQAKDLQLDGYAENLADGRVEVVVEGDRREVEHFLVKLRAGPPHAEVEGIDVAWGQGGPMRPGFYVY